MTTITLQTAARRSAPRLAQPIATAAAAVIAQVSGWLRPRPLTRGEEAAQLRELALRFHSQPSFAADLLAAADRHVGDSE
jgi:hypothetical protein